MSLAGIVRVMGGDLYAGGHRANIPAPGHSHADRSVSLLLDCDRVVVHTFNGCDWREVLAVLQERGLVDADGRLAGLGHGPALGPASREELGRFAGIARAQAIWAEGRPVGGSLSERHARLRAISRPLPAALRHHAALPLAAYRGQGTARPAMLAAIRDAQGELCGVEATYLAADGTRARMALPRKTLGRAPSGCAVRLDPAAAHMLVAEGVFTALSASERFGLPAWALLSVGNLRAWSPPTGVRRVTIAADVGAAGEAGAAVLSGRLRRLGLVVTVRAPPAPALDWNDAAKRP
ncbi:MAG TPA: toprim domain-containing protein [Phenylobacterium sp.]|nr:toprim domain-containing protein [Phenylobacterium sp.]